MLLLASSQPAATIALKPIIATPIAITHMRMRVQSPMVTMSETAPIVQKWVRCAIAPNSIDRPNADQSTSAARDYGSASSTSVGALLQRPEPLAPGLRGFGLRVGSDQVVDGLARAPRVFQLGLAVRDREHRLGRLRVVGRGADQAAERRDRLAVLAHAVLRVAEPEQRGLVVAAARVALAKRGQRIHGAGEVALAQQFHRLVVLALLVGLDAELLAALRDLLRFELAQAVVDARLDVLLLALHLGHVARELLVLAAQLGVVRAHLLELVVQVEQAALELLDLLAHLALLAPLALDVLADVEDRAARLVVVEQAGMRRRREQRRAQAQAAECGARDFSHGDAVHR